MKAIELQRIFNKEYAKALHYRTIDKKALYLLDMLNKLNDLRLQEGIDILSLPNLEKRAIWK